MRVLNLLELALSSVSTPDAEPHSANWRKPSVATCSLPQKEKLGTCEAPIKSLKWVSQTENGKSFGWVTFDQIPSIINWKRGGICVRSRRYSPPRFHGPGFYHEVPSTELRGARPLSSRFVSLLYFTKGKVTFSYFVRTYFTRTYRSILFSPRNFARFDA